MRISDWSSDVCSSDLTAAPALAACNFFLFTQFLGNAVALAFRFASAHHNGAVMLLRARVLAINDQCLDSLWRLCERRAAHEGRDGDGKQCQKFLEIGRASCRERVCQYV